MPRPERSLQTTPFAQSFGFPAAKVLTFLGFRCSVFFLLGPLKGFKFYHVLSVASSSLALFQAFEVFDRR